MAPEIIALLIVFIGLLALNVPVAVCIGLSAVIARGAVPDGLGVPFRSGRTGRGRPPRNR
jgi:hypothetical protein